MRFLLKRQTSVHTLPHTHTPTHTFVTLRDDQRAWTDQNSLTGIGRQ